MNRAAGMQLRGAFVAALLALAIGGAAGAEPSASGAELYELCAQCHGSAGQGNALVLAPNIAGLDAWYVVEQVSKFKSGLRGLHPADVAGLRMYPMSRAVASQDDLHAVADYIAGLPRVSPAATVEGGDAERGRAYYAPCAACHGDDGAGNQALLAPRLAGANDWYLLSSLERYKSGVRAANPANANAQVMRGMAATLPDEQALRDVVAYITTLMPAATAAK